MSSLVSTAELEFVEAMAGLRASVEGRLTALLWSEAGQRLPATTIRDSVMLLTREFVREYGIAAADFATDWYNDLRATSNIRGNFTATGYPQDFDEQVDATVRRAAGSLFGTNSDVTGFVTAVVSKASQYVVDGARNTIAQNSYRDPRASGWQRIPRGKTCDFCLMLVGRGGVYRKSTVTFRSHHDCDCGCAPSWDLDAQEVPSIAYEASSRMQGLRDAAAKGNRSAQRSLNAYRGRVEQYISDNQAEFAKLRQDFNLTPAD